MTLDFYDKAFWQSVVAGFLVAIVLWFPGAANTWLLRRSRKRNVIVSPRSLIGLYSAVLIAGSVSSAIYVHSEWPRPEVFVFITSVALSALLVREIRRFWTVGIVGASCAIDKGIDVDRALSMCSNCLDFAGLGAHKLTSSLEFKDAMWRCNRPDRPIRFLLASPDSEMLVQAARQAARPDRDYTTKVLASLRILAELHNERQLNIQVRFYPPTWPKPPAFRIMIINDAVALVSYYKLGEGSGTRLPQMFLVNFGPNGRDVDSFYYGFQHYFCEAWDAASEFEWDFSTYL